MKSQDDEMCSEAPELVESKICKVKRYTWSTSSIELFFEGLFQHGKDFPKILDHMQAKQRKGTDYMLGSGLTKDQVRFFYYRTWHKVSLLLPDSEKSHFIEDSSISVDGADVNYEDADVALDSSMEEKEDTIAVPNISEDINYSCTETEPKDRRKEALLINGIQHSLDLVALICYWKLKQKLPVSDQHFGKKLSELIFVGTTTVPGKNKGKRRYQLKIPSCGAFRGTSVENISESEQQRNTCSKGRRISIEMTPLTTSSWLTVQKHSLNPRLRLHTYASKDVRSLVLFVQNVFSLNSKYVPTIHIYDKKEMCLDSCCHCQGVIDKLSWLYENKEVSHNQVCQGLPHHFVLGDIFQKYTFEDRQSLHYDLTRNEFCIDYQVCKLVKFASFLHSSAVFRKENNNYSPVVNEYLKTLNRSQQLAAPLPKYKQLKMSSPKRLKSKLNYSDSNVSLRSKRLAFTSKDKMRQIIPKPLSFFPKPEYDVSKLDTLPQPKMDASLMDSEIKGAVVEKFLAPQTETSGKDGFSSSDTVNELLRGFSDDKLEESPHSLLEDASQILPSFSQVLNSFYKGQSEFAQGSSKCEVKDSCTSLFDDGSSDYISKFKELASTMENNQS